MNSTSFFSQDFVKAEMHARYGITPEHHERPGSSLHVIQRVRARVRATRSPR